MIDTQERLIGDTRYKVEQLGFRKGRKVFFAVAKIVSPALGELVKGQQATEVSADLAGEYLGKAIEAFADNIDDERVRWIEEELAAKTLVQQGDSWIKLRDIWELHFAGLHGWAGWLKFALEVNFSDFLSESGGLLGDLGLAGATKIPSRSQSGLTGKHGDSSRAST